MTRRASTLDAAEVELFDSLSAQWWDPEGPMRALHRINPLRIEWMRDLIAERFPSPDGEPRDVRRGLPLRGLNILDIGCGAGLLCEPLARLGAKVTGVDPSPRNIEAARAHAEDLDLAINYRVAEAETLQEEGARFDVVAAMEVIEHVASPSSFLATACALTAPRGLLVTSTLNRTLKSYLLGIVAAEYILRWAPKGAHRWEKFITPEEIETWLARCHFRPIARTGVIFDPLARQWRLGRDMDVNYMMAAAPSPA